MLPFKVESGWSPQSPSLRVSCHPPILGGCPSHSVPIHSQRQRPHISWGGGLSPSSPLGEIHHEEVGSPPFLPWLTSLEGMSVDLCPLMTTCDLKPLRF